MQSTRNSAGDTSTSREQTCTVCPQVPAHAADADRLLRCKILGSALCKAWTVMKWNTTRTLQSSNHKSLLSDDGSSLCQDAEPLSFPHRHLRPCNIVLMEGDAYTTSLTNDRSSRRVETCNVFSPSCISLSILSGFHQRVHISPDSEMTKVLSGADALSRASAQLRALVPVTCARGAFRLPVWFLPGLHHSGRLLRRCSVLLLALVPITCAGEFLETLLAPYLHSTTFKRMKIRLMLVVVKSNGAFFSRTAVSEAPVLAFVPDNFLLFSILNGDDMDLKILEHMKTHLMLADIHSDGIFLAGRQSAHSFFIIVQLCTLGIGEDRLLGLVVHMKSVYL
nr:hypothetical protein CFP56_03657 [Quercus suber]